VDDLACLTDRRLADLRVITHQGLLGGMQATDGVRVAFDLYDGRPLTVEQVDRGDAAFFSGSDEDVLHPAEPLRKPSGNHRGYCLPKRRECQAGLRNQWSGLPRHLSSHPPIPALLSAADLLGETRVLAYKSGTRDYSRV
jgi:hypothetical protein